jgi:hypothetical protein
MWRSRFHEGFFLGLIDHFVMAITAGQAPVQVCLGSLRQPERPLLRLLMNGRTQMRKISLFNTATAVIATGFGLWVFAVAAAMVATGFGG